MLPEFFFFPKVRFCQYLLARLETVRYFRAPFASTLFGLTGSDIAYIKAGAELGLGTLDLNSVKVEEITV